MAKSTLARRPDGIDGSSTSTLPGSSNAMVIFRHPGGASARLDRYNWFISNGPEARSVTSHLSRTKVLESLDDDDLRAALSPLDEHFAARSAVPGRPRRTADVARTAASAGDGVPKRDVDLHSIFSNERSLEARSCASRYELDRVARIARGEMCQQ